MKFFRQASPRRRSSRPTIPQVEEQGSLGSELSNKDQFDIVVPIKSKSSGWKLFDKDDSTCSSITTDDRRYYYVDATDPNYSSRILPPSKHPSSWCCCSGGGTAETTAETDNTLLLRTRDVAGQASEGHSTEQLGGCCCGGQNDAEPHRPQLEKHHLSSSTETNKSPMREGASLFDNLSEDEHDKKNGPRRKWKPRLWKRKQ